MNRKALELYIHIPFCIRKCAYCDFLSFPAGEALQTAYVQALDREIRKTAAFLHTQEADGLCLSPDQDPDREAESGAADPDPDRKAESGTADQNPGQTPEYASACEAYQYVVTSVFFGGGTPSVLPSHVLCGILKTLRECFAFAEDAEITLEVNPGTVDAEKLTAYRAAGWNRISIGCQSLDDRELKALGRIHTAAEAVEAYQAARAAGFANINLDLMSAIPGQKMEGWERTLRAAARLGPEHISAYSLILEEGTPFFVQAEKGELDLPDEEEERRMYERTEEILSEYGYHRYEISNYAKEGYACRHNCGYWTGTAYLGFGLGAASYIGQTRFQNPSDPDRYLRQYGEKAVPEAGLKEAEAYGLQAWIRKTKEGIEPLSFQDRMAEYMILGLRMMRGVSDAEFTEGFGCSFYSVYGEVIKRYLDLGLLASRPDGRIALTRRGISLSNQVMADLLP